MTTYYIGADVHSNSTELAIERNKKIVQRYKLPTSIAALSNVLDSLKGEKHLAIEEGPMAGCIATSAAKLTSLLSATPAATSSSIPTATKTTKSTPPSWPVCYAAITFVLFTTVMMSAERN
jgi:hypothetical protein